MRRAVLRGVSSGETKGSISSLVPLEVANAMVKFKKGADAPAEVNAIFSMGLEVCPVEGTDVREAAEIVQESRASPYDCTHSVIMKRYGLTEIVPADKDFDRFEWVERTDPRSFGRRRWVVRKDARRSTRLCQAASN